MSQEEINTFKKASELYKFAWTEVLSRFASPQSLEIEEYVDELKEALLDLKQATIDLDPVRVMKHTDEVLLLVAELIDRSSDG